MKIINIYDNNDPQYDCKDVDLQKWISSLAEYSGKTIDELCTDHDLFSTIPFINEKNRSREALFHLQGSKIKTGNIGGFFGVKNEKGEFLEVRIRSRFDKSEQQYFVKHMLSYIAGIDLLQDLKTHSDFNGFFDFLLFLFPSYLRKALNQGIYKSYKVFEYNDSKPKGKIDVSRHIAHNIPFQGNIAYSFREYTPYNNLMLLIREVIEHIKRILSCMLTNSNDFRNDCQIVIDNTKNYGKTSRHRLIELNSRPINNPYYIEYESLRKLCLRILKNEELKFSDSADEIYGVVYELNWLWEEYLNVLFSSSPRLNKLIHSENKIQKRGISPFSDYEHIEWYPDFYSIGEKGLVLDAKYKNYQTNKISSEDVQQLTAYLHILKSDLGAVLFPQNTKECQKDSYELKGYGGRIHKFGLYIPQDCSLNLFIDNMKESENFFIKEIEKWIEANMA